MKTLLATLHDYDPGMLPALADVWGVDSKRLQDEELVAALGERMLDADAAQAVWDKLDETAQGALRALAGSAGGRMPSSLFSHTGNGKIRKLGRAQIARLRPHIDGESIAETLYYRGFIGEAHDKVAGNIVSVVYVPSDLAACLPLQKTSYDNLDAPGELPDGDPMTLKILDDAPADAILAADTSIVDDMTSLLALLQAGALSAEDLRSADSSRAVILPALLRADEYRLRFLLGIGVGKLIAMDEGIAKPHRQEARKWLAASRAQQIRALSADWRSSATWRDMWHIEGLHPDDSGWAYDAAAARSAILSLLAEILPPQGWVSLSELIELIKESEPDFQRPDGDYESWYIRNDEGEFLRGFESWDAVEGALIEYLIAGPMHWLGLVDVADDLLRLTAYGRAFLGQGDWPSVSEPPVPFAAQDDGALLASRRCNRFERFQLARFATCLAAADPYVYAIDAASMERAEAQGISRQQVHTFLSKQLSGAPPLAIIKLLREWGTAAKTSVTLERHIVLRTTSPEEMDKIFAFPAYRRYLGARLGDMACAVRAEQWQQLQERLVQDGIEVDSSRLDD